ncbi:MAG: hypothetical protein ACK56F_05560 [bacterium]
MPHGLISILEMFHTMPINQVSDDSRIDTFHRSEFIAHLGISSINRPRYGRISNPLRIS